MNKILSISLFCCVSVLFAQEKTNFKNAIGWESGLSYRRYIKNDIWVGINLSGSYDNTLSSDTQFNSTTFITNDSTSKTTSIGKDTNKVFSGTIKIELGKEIFSYKKLEIDAFVAAGFTLTDNKSYSGVSSSYFNETKGHSILGIIAFEPKVFLWEKISIGTQIGIQYSYTDSKFTYDDQYNNSTNSSIRLENRSTLESNFKLFGNISLSSILVMHYYF